MNTRLSLQFIEKLEFIENTRQLSTNDVNPKLVTQVVDAFNKQARHGNVSSELAMTDVDFWVITTGIALCEHTPECDPAFATEVRDQKLYE